MPDSKHQSRAARRRTTMRTADPFAVKESDSDRRMELPAKRIYLRQNEKPPAGIFVQEGPRGGRFYVADGRTRPPVSDDVAARGLGDGQADDPSAGDPGLAQDEMPDTAQTAAVDDVRESTLARIREALAAADIPPASPTQPDGYVVTDDGSSYHVDAEAVDEAGVKKLSRRIIRALSQADFVVSRDGDTAVVEKPKDALDPGIEAPDELLDPEDAGAAVKPKSALSDHRPLLAKAIDTASRLALAYGEGDVDDVIAASSAIAKSMEEKHRDSFGSTAHHHQEDAGSAVKQFPRRQSLRPKSERQEYPVKYEGDPVRLRSKLRDQRAPAEDGWGAPEEKHRDARGGTGHHYHRDRKQAPDLGGPLPFDDGGPTPRPLGGAGVPDDDVDLLADRRQDGIDHSQSAW